MGEIPAQRSYEQLPTESLRVALAAAEERHWQLLDQVAAAQVTITALRNVIKQRHSAS